jgi:hypothetical protein
MRLVRWIESDGSAHQREFGNANAAWEFAVEMDKVDWVESIAVTLADAAMQIADVACQVCGSITIYADGKLRCLNCGAMHDIPRMAIRTE